VNEILLIGGGGHCRLVIDVIEQEGKYIIINNYISNYSNIFIYHNE